MTASAPPPLTIRSALPARSVLLPLLALALGGFGIGLTEFIASGLLPQVAHDLLRQQYDRSNSAGVAEAGWIVSTYAAGVVVGAPLIALCTARVPRRQLVLGLLVVFVVGTLASAAAPSFPLLLAARFVAGLPHGAYFGAAGMLASSIMGPGRQARGFAIVLGGLTFANVVGVPLITSLGQATSWRLAYVAIAVVFALAFLAVLLLVPPSSVRQMGSPREELGVLAQGRVWIVVVMISIGLAGFFAVDSYIAPVTTHLAHLSSGTVPWVLVAVGLGMTTGNALGGWLSDSNVSRSLLLGFPCFAATLVLFALTAGTAPGLFAAAFLVGASTVFLAPPLQALLITTAPNANLMGAAINQSSMNIANSLGAAVGALVIGHGLGYRASAWVGAAMALVAWLLALLILRPARTGQEGH
jgi:MFS transporter, DHA1 family, inner membrane transport protein